MTPAQLADAQRLSSECLKNGLRRCELGTRSQTTDRESPQAPRSGTPQPASTGSGFFVSAEGHAITNAHVVDGCKSLRSSKGDSFALVLIDRASDLAMVKAAVGPTNFARIQGGRGVRPGQSVVAVGFPYSGALSSTATVTTGTVAALSGPRDDRRLIQITAPVQPGNSGGPLLGPSGAVVGVVASKLNAITVAEAMGDIPQNINFAISSGTLQSFLNATGVPFEMNNVDTARNSADIAAEAFRYTILIECIK